MIEINKIYNEDCTETMNNIEDESIDMILQDPPYNKTNCKWDISINLAELWEQWNRIIKPNGAMIFTGSQPFTSDLIQTNRSGFRYEWIWQKNRGNNFINTNYMPFKEHENILVFYKKKPTYNPQRILRSYESLKRDPIGSTRNKYSTKVKERVHKTTKVKHSKTSVISGDGLTMPSSILYFKINNSGNLHETQKPLDLFRYLIKTYTNEGNTVFDGYMGSGTTAIACIKENRKYIGSEIDKKYFKTIQGRIKRETNQYDLFNKATDGADNVQQNENLTPDKAGAGL